MKSVLFSIVIILIFYSCKKYDDGPVFSLRKPDKRLCRKWKFSSTEQDGQTVTFNYNPKYNLEFKKDGKFIARLASPYNQWNVPDPWEGTWQFFDEKEMLYTSIQVLNDTMKIKRLTSRELWIEDQGYGPSPVIYKFKKE